MAIAAPSGTAFNNWGDIRALFVGAVGPYSYGRNYGRRTRGLPTRSGQRRGLHACKLASQDIGNPNDRNCLRIGFEPNLLDTRALRMGRLTGGGKPGKNGKESEQLTQHVQAR